MNNMRFRSEVDFVVANHHNELRNVQIPGSLLLKVQRNTRHLIAESIDYVVWDMLTDAVELLTEENSQEPIA